MHVKPHSPKFGGGGGERKEGINLTWATGGEFEEKIHNKKPVPHVQNHPNSVTDQVFELPWRNFEFYPVTIISFFC